MKANEGITNHTRDTENQYNGTELSNLVYGLFPVTLPIFFMIGKFIRIFFEIYLKLLVEWGQCMLMVKT